MADKRNPPNSAPNGRPFEIKRLPAWFPPPRKPCVASRSSLKPPKTSSMSTQCTSPTTDRKRRSSKKKSSVKTENFDRATPPAVGKLAKRSQAAISVKTEPSEPDEENSRISKASGQLSPPAEDSVKTEPSEEMAVWMTNAEQIKTTEGVRNMYLGDDEIYVVWCEREIFWEKVSNISRSHAFVPQHDARIKFAINSTKHDADKVDRDGWMYNESMKWFQYKRTVEPVGLDCVYENYEDKDDCTLPQKINYFCRLCQAILPNELAIKEHVITEDHIVQFVHTKEPRFALSLLRTHSFFMRRRHIDKWLCLRQFPRAKLGVTNGSLNRTHKALLINHSYFNSTSIRPMVDKAWTKSMEVSLELYQKRNQVLESMLKSPCKHVAYEDIFIKNTIDECKEPLIGLEYVIEIYHGPEFRSYFCRLCCALCAAATSNRAICAGATSSFGWNTIMAHLKSLKHRMDTLQKGKFGAQLETVTNTLKGQPQPHDKEQLTKEIEQLARNAEGEEGRKPIDKRLEFEFSHQLIECFPHLGERGQIRVQWKFDGDDAVLEKHLQNKSDVVQIRDDALEKQIKNGVFDAPDVHVTNLLGLSDILPFHGDKPMLISAPADLTQDGNVIAGGNISEQLSSHLAEATSGLSQDAGTVIPSETVNKGIDIIEHLTIPPNFEEALLEVQRRSAEKGEVLSADDIQTLRTLASQLSAGDWTRLLHTDQQPQQNTLQLEKRSEDMEDKQVESMDDLQTNIDLDDKTSDTEVSEKSISTLSHSDTEDENDSLVISDEVEAISKMGGNEFEPINVQIDIEMDTSDSIETSNGNNELNDSRKELKKDCLNSLIYCTQSDIPEDELLVIQEQLDHCEDPLIGVDQVIQVCDANYPKSNWHSYLCQLCALWISEDELIEHLLSDDHRILYMATNGIRIWDPILESFSNASSLMQNPEMLISAVQQVETSSGRMSITQRSDYRLNVEILKQIWPGYEEATLQKDEETVEQESNVDGSSSPQISDSEVDPLQKSDKQTNSSQKDRQEESSSQKSDKKSSSSQKSDRQASPSQKSDRQRSSSQESDRPASSSQKSDNKSSSSHESDRKASSSQKSDRQASPSQKSDRQPSSSQKSDRPASSSQKYDRPASSSHKSYRRESSSHKSDRRTSSSPKSDRRATYSQKSDNKGSSWHNSEKKSSSSQKSDRQAGSSAQKSDRHSSSSQNFDKKPSSSQKSDKRAISQRKLDRSDHVPSEITSHRTEESSQRTKESSKLKSSSSQTNSTESRKRFHSKEKDDSIDLPLSKKTLDDLKSKSVVFMSKPNQDSWDMRAMDFLQKIGVVPNMTQSQKTPQPVTTMENQVSNAAEFNGPFPGSSSEILPTSSSDDDVPMQTLQESTLPSKENIIVPQSLHNSNSGVPPEIQHQIEQLSGQVNIASIAQQTEQHKPSSSTSTEQLRTSLGVSEDTPMDELLMKMFIEERERQKTMEEQYKMMTSLFTQTLMNNNQALNQNQESAHSTDQTSASASENV